MVATAYAALLALSRSLQDILDLQHYDADPLLHRQKFVSLKENVDSIVTFLEDYSDKLYHKTLDVGIHGIIRKAAFEAQDFIDSYLYEVSNTDDECSSCDKPMKLDQDLNMAFERIDFILKEKTKLTDTSDQEKDFQSRSAASFPVDPSSTAKNMVVGFDDDLKAIKERLYEDSEKLQIIPIVGMGGMGKTTLARRTYEDSLFSQYFDICAWITVSQVYQRREILSGLFQFLTKSDNDQFGESDAQLAKLVYQNLVGRRYLIVVDDIWSTKAWDDLKMLFPNECNGSRILLTTRILDVAAYSGSSDHALIHQMKFLNEDHSWKLLQQRVFGQQQSCPPQLVEIGKKITKNCGGLPLTIVVVAGLLLSSSNVMREELWENISENITSTEPTIALQCTKILCFSYDRLPIRLKPCFLYVAIFPEDDEIDVSKLIKLWAAEGFLKPNDDQSKCLEDVGERHLEDLVNRSLMLVSKRGLDGKLETVGIHDILREICIKKAEQEEFLHHHLSPRQELINNSYRRLKIDSSTILSKEIKIKDPSLRSILFSSWRPQDLSLNIASVLISYWRLQKLSVHVHSRHICILDTPHIRLANFSNAEQFSALVNLRYFRFTIQHESCLQEFLLISNNPNLETIDIFIDEYDERERDFQVPYEILEMSKLRHLMLRHPYATLRLSYPSDGVVNVQESNLQTLFCAYELSFPEVICIRIFGNLKILKVEYDFKYYGWDDFNFDNLFLLQNLEDLQISMCNLLDPSMTWSHSFPMGLKKLHLNGVPLDWENMSIIGSLPNLQVLKMIGGNSNSSTSMNTSLPNLQVFKMIIGSLPCLVLKMICGKMKSSSKWKTVEGEFLQLKYFCSDLDNLWMWETEKEHFPSLESLILLNPQGIKEIPSGIGEIDSLQYIELRECGESLVNSTKQIQKLQHENGNDAFRVRVIDTHGQDVLF